MRYTRVLATLVSFSALIGFGITAHAQELPSGILRMADGRYYQPSTGTVAADLAVFGVVPTTTALTDPNPATSPLPIAPTENISTTTQAVRLFPLKAAILRAQDLLQKAIDMDGSGKAHVEHAEPTWRAVTLAIWNPKTDDIRTVSGEKNGVQLRGTDAGLEDVDVTVANGVNSGYVISSTDGEVVVAVRYEIATERSITKKKKVWDVRDVVYTPNSAAIQTPELIQEGKEWLDRTVAAVYDDLRAKKVMSRTFPELLVADVLDPEFVKSIILIEHLDTNALKTNAQRQLGALYVTLGANESASFNYSRSAVGALGLVQFMPKTYASVAKWKEYALDPSFESGMSNAMNAIRAEVAYLDYLMSCFPSEVTGTYAVEKDKVHEYVAAAYNGGATRTYKAMAAWEENLDPVERLHVRTRSRLRLETMNYVLKLRRLRAALAASEPILR